MKLKDDTKRRFGKKLHSLRKTKEKTQKEVADAIDVSAQTISYYERGTYYPTMEHCLRLGMYFGVSVDELF